VAEAAQRADKGVVPEAGATEHLARPGRQLDNSQRSFARHQNSGESLLFYARENNARIGAESKGRLGPPRHRESLQKYLLTSSCAAQLRDMRAASRHNANMQTKSASLRPSSIAFSLSFLVVVAFLSDVASLAVFATEASSEALIAAATQFVDLLANDDFAKATEQFDSTMKGALPEGKLRQVWQSLQQQAGPFKEKLRARTEKVSSYDVVFVTCHFEKADLDAKVVFDTDKHIAGLFFVPSQPAADSSTAPSYAKISAYKERDFTVGSGEWALPGALTMPVGLSHLAPAVVLVHGSGPNDRDETVLANKPFRDLAWGLASKGIAVLRYEKRTKEYATKLSKSSLAHFTVKEETIDDAVAAASQLRATEGIDPHRVFVLGHSLGGTVAPRIGQADPNLAGIIIMAGATRPLEDLVVEQTRYLAPLHGKLSDEDQAKVDALLAEANKVKRLTAADESSSSLLLNAPPSYWLDLREHDPLTTARTLRMPMLILQGARDYQVTEADFDGWKKALDSRPDVTFKIYSDLNHMFMTGKGKSTPEEYEQAGHVSEVVVDDIAGWISKSESSPH
jgi:uncharacterized protein